MSKGLQGQTRAVIPRPIYRTVNWLCENRSGTWRSGLTRNEGKAFRSAIRFYRSSKEICVNKTVRENSLGDMKLPLTICISILQYTQILIVEES